MYGFKSLFLHVGILLSQHLLLIILSQLNSFGPFVENQLTINVWFMSELSSFVPLMFSVMLVPHYLDYCNFVLSFGLGSVSLTV